MTRLGEAVEALARAMGLWREQLGGLAGRWTVSENEGGSTVVGPAVPDPDEGGWMVPEPYDPFYRDLPRHEAMLWIRCYLLGTTRVRCPDCEGSRVMTEPDVWATMSEPMRRAVRLAMRGESVRAFTHHRVMDGLFTRGLVEHLSHDLTRHGRIVHAFANAHPCPTCTGPAVECEACHGIGEAPPLGHSCRPCKGRGTLPGKPTGHVDLSWAEVFLAAMPTPAVVSKVAEHWGNVGQAMAHLQGETVSETPGDPESRGQLTRLADQLQVQALEGLGGDSPEQHPDLGVWLALFIGQQKCDACKGECETVVSKHDSLQAYLDTDEMIRTARTMPPGHRVVGQPDSSVHIIAPCPDCSGSGLALGSHAAAMASAALELADALTAQAVAS